MIVEGYQRACVRGIPGLQLCGQKLHINTLRLDHPSTCFVDHVLLAVMFQVQPLANHMMQIEEEQWWDIDRDELPADRPVYQDFN